MNVITGRANGSLAGYEAGLGNDGSAAMARDKAASDLIQLGHKNDPEFPAESVAIESINSAVPLGGGSYEIKLSEDDHIIVPGADGRPQLQDMHINSVTYTVGPETFTATSLPGHHGAPFTRLVIQNATDFQEDVTPLPWPSNTEPTAITGN